MPRPPLRARARQQPATAKQSASENPARRRQGPPPAAAAAAPAQTIARTASGDNGNDNDAEADADVTAQTTTTTSAAADSDDDDDADPLPSLPLFNTTFNTFRASPLHVGPQPLTAVRLDRIAHSLRDALVGDVVRGVQVRLPGDVASGGGGGARYGALTLATLTWARFDVAAAAAAATHSSSSSRQRGLLLRLQYEAGRCEALFLPPGPADDDGDGSDGADDARPGFLRLPLVLVRMPPALRLAVLGFVAREFDCRVSPLALPGADLLAAWEGWARDVGLRGDGEVAAVSPALSKDVVLTLAFRLPRPSDGPEKQEGEAEKKEDEQKSTPGLRSLDVTVPAADLSRFVERGQDLLRASASSSSAGRGPAAGPFTAALGRYLQHHLALDMHHSAVQVVRIACGGFVLSEGRLKMFKPSASGSGADDDDDDDDDDDGPSREAKAAHRLLARLCIRRSPVDAT